MIMRLFYKFMGSDIDAGALRMLAVVNIGAGCIGKGPRIKDIDSHFSRVDIQ